MEIALASMDPVWEQKRPSLARCRDLVTRAAACGAELVVFPEMTLTGFTMNAAAVAEPPDTSETVAAFQELARERRIALAFGVVLRTRARPHNCLVVVDSTGAEVARYAKLHPFSHAGEDRQYDGGAELVTARVGGSVFGLTVCYDLRFPEAYTMLAPACDALLVIANWPEQRIAHWYALLTARAIECQCYVVGVNRTGQDGNGIVYPRSSRVIDPRGVTVPAEHMEGELELYTLDMSAVAAYRAAFPTLRDRRPELYRELM